MSTHNLTFRSAIRSALREELARDSRVFLIGEDIGDAGGVYKVTEGLLAEFGPERVIDTPISETAIIGAALGSSITGLIPIAEIMFSDFTMIAMDQICNQAAKKSYLSGGRERAGFVVRAVTGAGVSFGPQHSQSLEAWFAHTPGLVSILPSNPRDARGLLRSAVHLGKPTIFFEHKALYPTEGSVPEEEELIPVGKCETKRIGEDLTIVSAGAPVRECERAAETLATSGISAELVDIRTLSPLDFDTISHSVEKTGRLLIVEEDVGFCGWGAEIAAQTAEQLLYSLKSPIVRIAAPYTPIPFSPVLEKAYLPQAQTVTGTARKMMSG